MVGTDTIIVALGGNALQDPGGEGTYAEQRRTVDRTAGILADLVVSEDEVVLTHGNGPQIGSILRQNLEAADVTPPMPLAVNGAQSQGLIGYLLQSALLSELGTRAPDLDVVPMITPVVVDADDPAFDEPTKPIGPYLSEPEARQLREDQDVTLREFPDHGYRQVVPSPDPESVFGVETVETIVGRGDVPIVAGGGGVPVVRDETGAIEGVDAVIDKDRTAALLGAELGADLLVILTNVTHVALHYGEPDQRDLEAVTAAEAREYLEEGHFARGSMYEKVEAACRFVEADPGRRAVITDLSLAAEAVAGTAGTQITSEG
ncbi:MAG: carbamate kinase [Halobacteriaceae archaeon]